MASERPENSKEAIPLIEGGAITPDRVEQILARYMNDIDVRALAFQNTANLSEIFAIVSEIDESDRKISSDKVARVANRIMSWVGIPLGTLPIIIDRIRGQELNFAYLIFGVAIAGLGLIQSKKLSKEKGELLDDVKQKIKILREKYLSNTTDTSAKQVLGPDT